MGLHHATLKAAVTRYGALLASGLVAAAIKAEIAKDEKGFSVEEVDEIYEAIIAEADEQTQNTQTQENQNQTDQAPAWVAELMESNRSVIAFAQALSDSFTMLLGSNKSVIDTGEAIVDSVNKFKDSANDIVKQILSVGKEDTSIVPTVEEPKINKEAKYVVSTGRDFWDRDDHTRHYEAGDNVSHLDETTLLSLLDRKLIEEEY